MTTAVSTVDASVNNRRWWLLGAIVSFYFGAREAH